MGVKAIFYNGSGAYCTPLVEWQSQGVLYRVTMKNGREDKLTQIANSAIAADTHYIMSRQLPIISVGAGSVTIIDASS